MASFSRSVIHRLPITPPQAICFSGSEQNKACSYSRGDTWMSLFSNARCPFRDSLPTSKRRFRIFTRSDRCDKASARVRGFARNLKIWSLNEAPHVNDVFTRAHYLSTGGINAGSTWGCRIPYRHNVIHTEGRVWKRRYLKNAPVALSRYKTPHLPGSNLTGPFLALFI